MEAYDIQFIKSRVGILSFHNPKDSFLNPGKQYYAVATRISDHWIITAAHALYDKTYSTSLSENVNFLQVLGDNKVHSWPMYHYQIHHEWKNGHQICKDVALIKLGPEDEETKDIHGVDEYIMPCKERHWSIVSIKIDCVRICESRECASYACCVPSCTSGAEEVLEEGDSGGPWFLYKDITCRKYIMKGITSLQMDSMTVSPKLNQSFITDAVDEITKSESVVIDVER